MHGMRTRPYNLSMIVTDLGTMPYREAWIRQENFHDEVVGGAPERLLLVEHPPVITRGRRSGNYQNLLAGEEQLARIGVELVQSDRGGDITFHGPGQIVAYPIIRLNDHSLSVGGYVRALENGVIAALAEIGIAARREQGAVGVWTDDPAAGTLAKICAIGVRIRRGVSLHGVALNVTTDLSYFNLIVPCGLVGRPVTSVAQLLGPGHPPIEQIRQVLAQHLISSLASNSSRRLPAEVVE